MLEYGRDIGGSSAGGSRRDRDVHRVQTERFFNTESHGTALSTNKISRKGGVKSITRKIIRKTTTLTRGEERLSSEDLLTQSTCTTSTSSGGARDSPQGQRYSSQTLNPMNPPWGLGEDELQTHGRSYSRIHEMVSTKSLENLQKSNNGHDIWRTMTRNGKVHTLLFKFNSLSCCHHSTPLSEKDFSS